MKYFSVLVLGVNLEISTQFVQRRYIHQYKFEYSGMTSDKKDISLNNFGDKIYYRNMVFHTKHLKLLVLKKFQTTDKFLKGYEYQPVS